MTRQDQRARRVLTREIKRQLAELREQGRYWKTGAQDRWGIFVNCPAASGIGRCPGLLCEGCASERYLQDRIAEIKQEADAVEFTAAAAGIDLKPRRASKPSRSVPAGGEL